jgi:hypothetical protein
MGKAVIVAMNMLESMIVHPTSTRAEVSDIAITVPGGPNAVMISGESVHGKYVHFLPTFLLANYMVTHVTRFSLYASSMICHALIVLAFSIRLSNHLCCSRRSFWYFLVMSFNCNPH